jgi:hypothetical protein
VHVRIVTEVCFFVEALDSDCTQKSMGVVSVGHIGGQELLEMPPKEEWVMSLRCPQITCWNPIHLMSNPIWY